jgi:hypothetical protein
VSIPEMSHEELLALPVSFSVYKAGRALGMGSDKTHQMVKSGEFPITVRSLGKRKICTRVDLFAYLEMDAHGAPLPPAPAKEVA